jgi:predicted transcriptional regulator
MARFVEIAQAIRDFVSASDADLSNIDEIYVEYELGKFERLYAGT